MAAWIGLGSAEGVQPANGMPTRPTVESVVRWQTKANMDIHPRTPHPRKPTLRKKKKERQTRENETKGDEKTNYNNIKNRINL